MTQKQGFPKIILTICAILIFLIPSSVIAERSFDEPKRDQTSGEMLYYLHDNQGSVVGLVNEAGFVVESYEYEPYGETHIKNSIGDEIQSSAYGNPFMWTGQRYDDATGLYHFPARSYSPELGRFLQRDPIGYADSLNLYEYVTSNPSTYTDPLGQQIGVRQRYPDGSVENSLIYFSIVNGFHTEPLIASYHDNGMRYASTYGYLVVSTFGTASYAAPATALGVCGEMGSIAADASGHPYIAAGLGMVDGKPSFKSFSKIKSGALRIKDWTLSLFKRSNNIDVISKSQFLDTITNIQISPNALNDMHKLKIRRGKVKSAFENLELAELKRIETAVIVETSGIKSHMIEMKFWRKDIELTGIQIDNNFILTNVARKNTPNPWYMRPRTYRGVNVLNYNDLSIDPSSQMFKEIMLENIHTILLHPNDLVIMSSNVGPMALRIVKNHPDYDDYVYDTMDALLISVSN